MQLRMVDLAGIREVLASKAGQIVVMDCWSTWCEPCLREFPNLVQIHSELGGEGVACLSLNLDYDGLDKPDALRPAVMSFLTRQNATFDNLMSTAESEVVYRELDFSSVPTVFVFGRDGAPVRKLSGARVDYGEVRAILRKLLDQGSGS